MAKINAVFENFIGFDDGNTISYDHEQDCCECNYADFSNLDPEARNYDFNMAKMRFEACDCGFRFGDCPERMFFVPCYSEQNGYYTLDIDIYFNGVKVLKAIQCDFVEI